MEVNVHLSGCIMKDPFFLLDGRYAEVVKGPAVDPLIHEKDVIMGNESTEIKVGRLLCREISSTSSDFTWENKLAYFQSHCCTWFQFTGTKPTFLTNLYNYLVQGLTNTICKGPENKYFRLHIPYIFSCNCPTVPL